jgi:membrane protein
MPTPERACFAQTNAARESSVYPREEGWTMITPRALCSLTRESVSRFSQDFAPSMGAALAYYTIFSIAPLLIIAIAVAGFVFGENAARGEVFAQLRGLIGDQGAAAIEATVKSASQTGSGTFAALVGIVILLLGATSVFAELQSDLDRIWDSPKPAKPGIWGILRGRVLSFGMVLGIGFLLLVSLVLSAALAALGHLWRGAFPGGDMFVQVVNFIVGFLIITGLFALIYKVLPRCDIGWADVWIGATVTSLLFSIGKSLIGLYLGRSSVASSFGAAGSLVIVLLWVYYSAQIFLFGAEFTRTYSYSHGTRKDAAEAATKATIDGTIVGADTGAAEDRRTKDEGISGAQMARGRAAMGTGPASAESTTPEAPAFAREALPAFAKLRIAAGIAAAVGLIAGEILSELRRERRFGRRA